MGDKIVFALGNKIGLLNRSSVSYLTTGDLEEVVSSEKYDYYLPKSDEEGNVYFIRKPFSINEKPKGSIKDTLLIPVKISRAIYNWMELFTMRYSGETFKKRGPNPAKSDPDEKQVFINGNLINADKALKENQKRGEKFPGIAPGDWELIKLDSAGKTHTLKRGVIDYDLTSEGDIIYSNGNSLIKLSIDGQEEVISKVELARVIKVI